MDKFIKKIDGLEFELKKDCDFDWLSKYGKVFCVFDQQDSGNICFGIANGNAKYFLKYAGAETVNYDGSIEEAIFRLKNSVAIYEELQHPNLIRLIDYLEQGNGYIVVFEWAEGECLHAHWDFDEFPKYEHPNSPNYRFNQLELALKLKCLEDIYSLHEHIAHMGYVAIDFYDGSIMYDFNTNKTIICDIDLYNKGPLINDVGRMWGSSRFMSPEEFEKGAIIDEVTNVYTMGATAFEILGNNRKRNILEWHASEKLFEVAKKAVSDNRSERYMSISEFHKEWIKALS